MKAPRNEHEFSGQAQPVEKVHVKFDGAMRPSPRHRLRKPRRPSLWQRFLNHPVFDLFRFIP